MQRTIIALAALLAAQLLLAGAVSVTEPDLAATRTEADLLAIEMETVDRIRITGPEGSEVVLARGDDGWVLPNTAGGFPASQGNVERLLEALTGLERGFAVATSADARERLRVAEDAFERRLEFLAGDSALATLYVGTSAGANRAHARTADDAGVYLVDFGAFNAPASSADWQDKTTLQIPREEIEAIVLGDLTLRRVAGDDDDAAGPDAPAQPTAEGGPESDEAAAATDAPAPRWRLEGGPADASLRPGGADALAAQLTNLRTDAVLGTERRDAYALDEPALALTVRRTSADPVELRLATRADADSYVLESSLRPEYFELGATRAEQLVDAAAPQRLLETPGGQPEAQDSADAPPAEGAASDGPDTPDAPAPR